MSERFAAIANRVADLSGRWPAFVLAFGLVLVWFVSGFFIGFSNTLYQLAINTGTTIITFLMVFLIQNSQNRNDLALHLKLDEIIRSQESADNTMILAEKETEEELQEKEAEFEQLVAAERSS